MRRVVTTLVLALAWTTVAAQVEDNPEEQEYPRYTVEVIVFEYAEDVSIGTERFLPEEPPPVQSDEPLEDEAVFGDPGTVADSAAAPYSDAGEQDDESIEPEFILHPEEEFTMADIASRLERLDVYRPILHFAWTQVTRPEEETRPIELAALTEPVEGLDGRFTLYLSRYLHLVVDLSLEQTSGLPDPVAIDDTTSVFRDSRGGATYDELRPEPVRYRISEDRIFKSGDLRYFDHPKFGVLAKITRVEEPEEEEAELVGKLGE